MTPLRPIEIVGGGLAGLSLGLALRRADVPVTIFEAHDYPRHRVCGEFIAGLPDTTRHRLGLDPFLADAAPNREVAWFIHQKLARIQTLPSPAPSLSRHRLDARLAHAFIAAGGDLRTRTRIPSPADAPGRIYATGRRPAASDWLGLKIHAIDLPPQRDLELHLGEHAYVGLARIEENRVNLCGLFRRRDLSAKGVALLLAYLDAANLRHLASRLASAATDPASFCAVAAVDFDPHVAPSAEVRVGDTCAMIPPFTGHGMAMAFQSAELALDPLLAFATGTAEWPATRLTIQRALRRHFRFRLASAGLLHAFLHRPAHQRWLAALNRAHALPLRPLYAALH